ncbi:MAG: GNAT family N-acetyltransferase [Gammaproteobacteria bacterium]|nr:GNAT family N-acetyltransferase [Gammaproteobacteria bacterium]
MTATPDQEAARRAATVPQTLEIAESRVYLRHPTAVDQPEFLELMHASRKLHHPWIQPPLTAAGYQQYLQRMARSDHHGFLVCQREDHRIAAVINLNNIVHGAFLSAYLGYYAGAGFNGRGLVSEGLAQVIRIAVDQLGLHRLEANIQPGNAASIALVRRLGFRREGFSPAYLFIAGAWRDHERWALVHSRDELLPPGIPQDVARQLP